MPQRRTGPEAPKAGDVRPDTEAGPDPPRTRPPGRWRGPVRRMHVEPQRTWAAPALHEDVPPHYRLYSSSSDSRDDSLDKCAGNVRSGCLPTAWRTTSRFISTTRPSWLLGGQES